MTTCTCPTIAPLPSCERPYCPNRLCRRCHICRHVGGDRWERFDHHDDRILTAYQQGLFDRLVVDPSLEGYDRRFRPDVTRTLFRYADVGVSL